MNPQNQEFILKLLQTHNYDSNNPTEHPFKPIKLSDLRLLYNSDRDGLNFNSYSDHIENQCDCVTIIKTHDGHTFGYYMDYPNGTTKSSFLFSVDKHQKYDLEDYKWIDQSVANGHPVDLALFWDDGIGWYYDEDHYYHYNVTCYDPNFQDDKFDYKTVIGNCRPTTEEEIEESGGYEAYIFEIDLIEVYTIQFNCNSIYTVPLMPTYETNIPNKDNYNIFYNLFRGFHPVCIYQASSGEWSNRKRFMELQRQLQFFSYITNKRQFKVIVFCKTTEGKTFGLHFGIDFSMFDTQYNDNMAQIISIDLNEIYTIPAKITVSSFDIEFNDYSIDLFTNYAIPYECSNKPITGKIHNYTRNRRTDIEEVFGIEPGQQVKLLEFTEIEVYGLFKNGQVVS